MSKILAQIGVFVAGAVIGTLLDRIHVAAGVLSYTHPTLAGQAIWVPLVFGLGGLAMVNGHRLFLPRNAAAEPGSMVAPGILLVVAYVATALFSSTPHLLTAAFGLAWIARLALAPAPDKLPAGLAFAVGGPLVEAALHATGGFSYHHPDLLSVPSWLPALYLHVSLLTRQIYLTFRPHLS